VKPSVGRTVHYTLNERDAQEVNRRRDDFAAFHGSHPHPHEIAQPGATGHIAHVGNPVSEGDVCAAVVVRVSGLDPMTVNLQVQLDGNDHYWATSRAEGSGPGTRHWPEREPG
jgi:hypothetical protein